ncbi:MAG: hypothetical protein ACXWZS_05615, partial [Gemmatirosa sp.]
AVALLAVVLTRVLTAACDRRRDGVRRLVLPALLALWSAFAWLAVRAYRAGEFHPAADAYDSSVLMLVGYATLVAIGVAGMLLAGVLWAWRAPRDPRGRGVALNASLVSYTAAATWLLVLGAVHLWPRMP